MDTNVNLLRLKWSRPPTKAFPKIWKSFYATDLNSETLTEYRIQDLPESRYDDAIGHMLSTYFVDEPMLATLDGSTDDQHIAYKMLEWRSILPQKAVLVCIKADSDEIVGVSFNFVNSREDNFFENLTDQRKSAVTKTIIGIVSLAYKNFDPFTHYGVNEYLASLGMSVDREYRGRSIGKQLLYARKEFSKEFGLKLVHSVFSSDFSNKIADQLPRNNSVSSGVANFANSEQRVSCKNFVDLIRRDTFRNFNSFAFIRAGVLTIGINEKKTKSKISFYSLGQASTTHKLIMHFLIKNPCKFNKKKKLGRLNSYRQLKNAKRPVVSSRIRFISSS